jgi:lamin tail-like protein/PEP-CTERM motif-containing protein
MNKCYAAKPTMSWLRRFIRTRELGQALAQAAMAAGICLLTASSQAAIIVSEVAAWGSGNSPIAADWFELTNTGPAAVNPTGWKMDDNSAAFATAVPMTGISNINPGESVIFIEDSTASLASAFKTLWFGGSPPAGLQIGYYSGSGVGLSTSTDDVTIFNGSGVLQAHVLFNNSAAGPFATFDNAAGLNNTVISQLSAVGVNGAFKAANDAAEIGSPGRIANVPEPASAALLVLGVAAGIGFVARRRS